MKITFAILVMFSSDLFSSEQSLIKGTRRAFEHTKTRETGETCDGQFYNSCDVLLRFIQSDQGHSAGV